MACEWDDDSIRAEAKGLPNGVAIITGRFERNPSLYYEMRLERSAKEIAANPSDLHLYDNAGVACDRLGKGDEAISWMEKKKVQLDLRIAQKKDDAEAREHLYRYYANLGTFWVHRWFRNGGDRSKLNEVQKARDYIAEAIKINPKAHFGRERYQLLAMDWNLSPKVVWNTETDRDESHDTTRFPDFLNLPKSYGLGDKQNLQSLEFYDAVEGLSGLIALGNAWESVDIFYALARALMLDHKPSLAYLAKLRCHELIDEGRGSMLAGSPTGNHLKTHISLYTYLTDRAEAHLGDEYARLRESANAWSLKRTDYILARLKQGRHPDTDADFWREYHEEPTPELTDTPPAPPPPLTHSSPDVGNGKIGRQVRWEMELVEMGRRAAAMIVVIAVGGILLIRVRAKRRSSAKS